MKVVVLGGYGVFGAKVVDLLVRDGHVVTVAGRSRSKAEAFVAETAPSATAMELDRDGDLAPLWQSTPEIVVDAAGPFHAYGDDPYRLARACIRNGVHYLDLADDPEFCLGIAALDAAAKAAGVFALSGASSVPAISSAAVASLAAQADEIDAISTAIMPGNRAPRGRAVVESILNQCGRPITVPIADDMVQRRSWSQPAWFDLGQGICRKAWLMEVPDTRAFADVFGARTVAFRAGMELGVMNHALAIISWLRARSRFGNPRWFVSMLIWIAARLLPFGTDVGGMSVAVTMREDRTWICKTWRLIATAGEGPFIPAVASRVILRAPQMIATGARPAIAEVTLDQIVQGMADLSVTNDVVREEITPVFPRFLGSDFGKLPKVVQGAHIVPSPRRLTGRAKVIRGRSLWARLLAGLFRFPAATDDIAVSVLMMPEQDGEIWERQFGTQVFRSHLRQVNEKMTERFGPFTFTLGLHVADGALHFPVASGRLGPLPLPRLLLPVSDASETERDGRFCFDVRLKAPLTGALMVHYQGWLEPAAGSGTNTKPRQLKSAAR